MWGSFIEKQNSGFVFTYLWHAEGLAAQSCRLILPLECRITYDGSGLNGFKMLKLFWRTSVNSGMNWLYLNFWLLFVGALNLNILIGAINN